MYIQFYGCAVGAHAVVCLLLIVKEIDEFVGLESDRSTTSLTL